MIRSIVLVKQVPDTANITGKVMNENGTVNRNKLPAVFNTEDRVALELALRVKDRYGGTVTALTMGPPRASDILRESLYMGADAACLVTDRKFAGADTLATSYVLCQAIKKLGQFDLVLAGRQAIDGDTAQVGPQTAEKLGIPQITHAQEILELAPGQITVRKKIDGGYEILKSSLPVLLTVIKSAAEPRPPSVKRVMAYKNAKSLIELEKMVDENSLLSIDELMEEYTSRRLFIPTLTTEDLDVDPERCGLKGSPTRVYKVDSVVLSGGAMRRYQPAKEALGELIDELVGDHILG
jgi:electron transfer flavoprotein beta subunit